MTIAENIKKILKRKPHWSCARVAEELGVSRNAASVAATRHNIRFMSRREVEDWIDNGKKKRLSKTR